MATGLILLCIGVALAYAGVIFLPLAVASRSRLAATWLFGASFVLGWVAILLAAALYGEGVSLLKMYGVYVLNAFCVTGGITSIRHPPPSIGQH